MMDAAPESLCPGCFAEKGTRNPCPHCGYDATAPRGPLVLPHRTLLDRQFFVGRVLGKPGGFGITYLGWDQRLETRVAIKEYLPRELAGRSTDKATAAPHTQEEGDLFRYGLEQFLREARTLAQLDHPNIVRVRQFFEANGTAYLVMDYYEGLSFAEYLEQQGGRLPEATAQQLLLPILDGLRAVHAKGFLHRDVKPQNIYLAKTDTGGARPILLDFGAARQAMGERSRSLSVVVSAGYAPFEQYHRKGKQGPWTDIYAAAAVLYRAVTGETPPEANERVAEDDLKPASAFGVSTALSDALSAALAIAPEARPQSVQAFQAHLRSDQPTASAQPATARPVPDQPDSPQPDRLQPDPSRPITPDPPANTPQPKPPTRPRQPERSWRVIPLLLIGLLVLVLLGFALSYQYREPQLVAIDGGCFQMGSPASEAQRDDDERRHWVCVEDFALGKYEVTQAQWQAVMGSNPSRFSDCSDCPVEQFSWNDVQDYIHKLNARTGKRYRLPTEAEWEYAARAGTTTPFWSGDFIDTGQANYYGNYDYDGCGVKTGVYRQKTLPVGSLQANPRGLYDVAGNVWEWTCLTYEADYGGAEQQCVSKNNAGPRALRGGSWGSLPQRVRSANRHWLTADYRNGDIGFSLAQDSL